MLTVLASLLTMGSVMHAPFEPVEPFSFTPLHLSASLNCTYPRATVATPLSPSPGMKIGSDGPPFHKLGDLPDADMEIAVNRMAGPCPIPETVIHNVMASRR